MKKNQVKFDLSNFEFIAESAEGKLVGGFSVSISSISDDDGSSKDDTANNCSGGNCVEGCGKGSNVKCNTVANCGS